MSQSCNQSIRSRGTSLPTKSAEKAVISATIMMFGNGDAMCGALGTNCKDNMSCGFIVKQIELVAITLDQDGYFVAEVSGQGGCECQETF